MCIKIRTDFQPVPWQLQRLLEYANIFSEYNIKDWSHLKNNEDFRYIYEFNWGDRDALEKIYQVGRDLAISMSDYLRWFNRPQDCPTLTSYLNLKAFSNNGWLGQISLLEELSQKAKNKVIELNGAAPWAIKEMIKLFDEQINLLYEIKKCLDGLKFSELYLREHNIGNRQIYADILNTINSIGKRFESLPRSYSGKDEESLRDEILIALSSIPDLVTLGEVFNRKGKTDIFATRNGNVEFIGECKFWHGPKAFINTIDQLLSYLTWRNEKAAIILFVRNKNITQVINAMLSSICSHPNYIRQITKYDKTWFNFEFSNNHQTIEVAVMLYHIPSP